MSGTPVPPFCFDQARFFPIDTLVDSAGIAGWQGETSHSLDCYTFAGGHFFLHDIEVAVVSQVNCELEMFLGKPICSV